MADLDDFFAKKDRKKSKSVKKFATADELAKKLEDTNKKSDVRPKKERPVQEGDESGRGGEEEEWKEYEEPVKDYTGLKIQVLQGGANAQEMGREQGEDSTPEGGRSKGPWNKPQTEPEPAAAPAPAAEEHPQPTSTKPSTYVPPAVRTRPAESLRRTHAKNAPDINNADYFPELGAHKRGGGGWSAAAPPSRAHPHTPHTQLALGNRFTSLQDDS